MHDPQEVVNESRLMLEEFLTDVGIYEPGQWIAAIGLRDAFSDWIDRQNVSEDDFWYLVVRVAAFICEYLIEGYSAVRYVDGKYIKLRMPIDTSQGIYREFDPYAAAIGLVKERKSLKKFLEITCSG